MTYFTNTLCLKLIYNPTSCQAYTAAIPFLFIDDKKNILEYKTKHDPGYLMFKVLVRGICDYLEDQSIVTHK